MSDFSCSLVVSERKMRFPLWMFRGPGVITYQSFVTFLMKPGGGNVCCLFLFMSGGVFCLSEGAEDSKEFPYIPYSISAQVLLHLHGHICLQIMDE